MYLILIWHFTLFRHTLWFYFSRNSIWFCKYVLSKMNISFGYTIFYKSFNLARSPLFSKNATMIMTWKRHQFTIRLHHSLPSFYYSYILTQTIRQKWYLVEDPPSLLLFPILPRRIFDLSYDLATLERFWFEWFVVTVALIRWSNKIGGCVLFGSSFSHESLRNPLMRLPPNSEPRPFPAIAIRALFASSKLAGCSNANGLANECINVITQTIDRCEKAKNRRTSSLRNWLLQVN